MWKTNHSPVPVPAPALEPVSTIHPTPAIEPVSRPRPVPAAQDSAVISKGQTFKGDITGAGPLFVDGHLEGRIHIPNERVTIGPNGSVAGGGLMDACIVAREIVIMGSVSGNVSASDRVEIRAEGTLNGDVSTARISIADGAYFQGGVDIRKLEIKAVAPEPTEEEEARTA